MSRDRPWFEMTDHRRRKLDNSVWIPLRSVQKIESVGKFGSEGNVEEFFGAGSILVPADHREAASALGWMDVGISHDHRPYADDDGYVPADQFEVRRGEPLGTHLVLQNALNFVDGSEWLIHPDLVLAFRLLREGDVWLCPDEGYEKVIELRRSDDGGPEHLAIRAEYLKDFLAARNAALYVTSYRSRREVVREVEFDPWSDEAERIESDQLRWEGRAYPIHEGGMPFGGQTAVFHAGHDEFDSEVDVPVLPHPTEGSFTSDSWVVEDQGDRLFVVWGELWKDEWVEPADLSVRIRGDAQPSTASFVVDAAGSRKRGDELTDEGRWLWFRPEVIPAIAHRRSGALTWYTRDTGGVSCIPSAGVHFGVNSVGLVNVYAKDIGYLPEWQKRIWAGANVGPDGGVSSELQDSQVRARPAETQAPEEYLPAALALLEEVSMRHLGRTVVHRHDQVPSILARAHRFRAVDEQGLFALAKDLARVTADLFDAAALNDLAGASGKQRVGSLKAMERVLGTRVGPQEAHGMMGPLFGIYELRLGDAHLPKRDQQEAFELAGVERTLPLVHQGYQLLHSCVATLYQICDSLRERPSDEAASE